MAIAKLRQTASRTTTAQDRPSSPTNDTADVPKSGKRLKRRLPPELDPGPLSDEPEMESDFQFVTISSLAECLKWVWRDRTDYFCAGNLSIYYYIKDPKSGRQRHRKLVFRGPDFFVVRNPLPKPTRNSWLVDNERGQFPNFILEVLSPKTKANDLGEKKDIYEKIFKTPEYFMVDPESETIMGFRLEQGRYQNIVATPEGLVWSEQLDMYLGMYDDPIRRHRLPHFFDANKQVIPGAPGDALRQMARAEQEGQRAQREALRAQLEAERAEREQLRAERAEQRATRAEQEKAQTEQEKAHAEQEKAQAEQEKARAEQEKAQAEQEKARLVEKLRALGISVDD
jgi:Uma2 family endonuclease